MTTNTVLASGTVIGQRYQVVRAVAQGGMGAVYEAADARLSGRRCAIKVLLNAGMTPQEEAEAAAWFAREAQLLSGLRHPLIPTISDFFSDQGQHYLVMDFVEGETLEERLAERGAPGLPMADVVGWGQQVCGVLQYLHTRPAPVIFRDLKPANIMREPVGTLRLIDFGIARRLDNTRTGHTIYTLIGTPGYSPPEQYQGLADPRSDVYSLGATLHHLISGRDPRQHQPFTFPSLSSLLPDVDPALDDAVTRAVSLQAEARFASAEEFGQALVSRKPRRASKPAPPSPPVPQGPPPDPLHPPLPQPASDVRVTTDNLYWPPVCACCCRGADTAFIIDYHRESARDPSRIVELSWHIPYCSTCARHARTYYKAHQREGRGRTAMWTLCTVVLCFVLSAAIGWLEWDIVLIPLASLAVGVLLATKAVKGKEDARALMQDTCADADYPLTYQDSEPVNEFRFTNGAYADMFARANADKLFD